MYVFGSELCGRRGGEWIIGMCLGCGGLGGGEWVWGLDQGLEGWGGVISGFFV